MRRQRLVRLRPIGRFVEPTTQCRDQRRMRAEPLGLNLRDAFLRAQQLALRDQHVQIVGQTAPIPFAREVVVLASRRDRTVGVLRLSGERTDPDHLIGDVLQRADDRLVIAIDCLVVPCRRRAELRAQTPAVEDRQRQRRTRAPAMRRIFQELEQRPHCGISADRRQQVDVRIEAGLGDVDAARLRRYRPARRDHVRPMADQIHRQCAWQTGGCVVERERRTLDRVARARTLAGQCGQLIAAECDLFFDLIDLAFVFRHWRFGLAYFELGADAAFQTPVRQVDDLLLLLQRGLGDIEQRVVHRHLDVRPHDIAFQFELGGAEIR